LCSPQAEWLLGDGCNLAGCLLTGDQLPTQTFTAVYYLGMDVVLLSQFCYYKCACAARRLRRPPHGDPLHADGDALREAAAPLLGGAARGRRAPGAATLLPALLCVCLAVASEALLQQQQHEQIRGHHGHLGPRTRGGPGPGAAAFCGAARRPSWASQLGSAAGWLSALCYAASRCSQLLRNAQRRSAAGLAPAMFALALAGNGLYAASVLLRARGGADVRRAAPWLAGSLGVMAADAVLLAQALHARRAEPPAALSSSPVQDGHFEGGVDGDASAEREADEGACADVS